MTKLVTMYGKKPSYNLGAPQYQFSLFSMSGKPENDPILNMDLSKLSNIDAGIAALYAINKAYPGITWGQMLGLTPYKKMGGKFGNFFRDTFSFTSRNIGDFVNWSGEKAGEAVRLLTDKEVVSGLSQYGAAYATGGASAGLTGMLDSLGMGQGGQDILKKLLGTLGMNAKQQTNTIAGINPIYLIGGAGLLLLIVILK